MGIPTLHTWAAAAFQLLASSQTSVIFLFSFVGAVSSKMARPPTALARRFPVVSSLRMGRTSSTRMSQPSFSRVWLLEILPAARGPQWWFSCLPGAAVFLYVSYTAGKCPACFSLYVILGWCRIGAMGQLFNGSGKLSQRLANVLGSCFQLTEVSWNQVLVPKAVLKDLYGLVCSSFRNSI
jgi:hypothetical protein